MRPAVSFVSLGKPRACRNEGVSVVYPTATKLAWRQGDIDSLQTEARFIDDTEVLTIDFQESVPSDRSSQMRASASGTA